MERKYLQILTWKRLTTGEEFIGKYHFKTSESAIKNANDWIYKNAKDISRAVIKVEVINKETKEVVWSWEA